MFRTFASLFERSPCNATSEWTDGITADGVAVKICGHEYGHSSTLRKHSEISEHVNDRAFFPLISPESRVPRTFTACSLPAARLCPAGALYGASGCKLPALLLRNLRNLLRLHLLRV